ncbi:hypothetical protein E2C01_030146 [Portunus trituberculatus]|uniref:Uncharacterized protein n=1 Tax=Portunus trituberculatus TaxID=210409 RepID=A0A5B7ETW6_PORTR|nr:hypothetical protein [Portunus trituberculatus]
MLHAVDVGRQTDARGPSARPRGTATTECQGAAAAAAAAVSEKYSRSGAGVWWTLPFLLDCVEDIVEKCSERGKRQFNQGLRRER